MAGIVFLALELDQNSWMMRTQTRNAITDSIINFQFNSFGTGLTALAIRANADPASVTPEEGQRVLALHAMNLRLCESVYYQYCNGLSTKASLLLSAAPGHS